MAASLLQSLTVSMLSEAAIVRRVTHVCIADASATMNTAAPDSALGQHRAAIMQQFAHMPRLQHIDSHDPSINGEAWSAMLSTRQSTTSTDVESRSLSAHAPFRSCLDA